MQLDEPITMPESEGAQVDELSRLLRMGSPQLVGPHGSIDLPASVYRALMTVVRNMQLGRSVVIVPEEERVTTQKAANILGVSRPHVVKLLDAKEMPFHKAGSHRRIFLRDVMAYAKRRDAERRKILAEIAREAYDNGFYENAAVPEGGDDE